MTVVFYEHSRFSGASKTFTANTPYVGNDFNDKASSMIIKAVGSSPPTPFDVGGFSKIVSQQTFEAMFLIETDFTPTTG